MKRSIRQENEDSERVPDREVRDPNTNGEEELATIGVPTRGVFSQPHTPQVPPTQALAHPSPQKTTHVVASTSARQSQVLTGELFLENCASRALPCCGGDSQHECTHRAWGCPDHVGLHTLQALFYTARPW